MKKLPIARIPWPIEAKVLKGLLYQTLIQDRELEGSVEVMGIDVEVVDEQAYVAFLVPGEGGVAPPRSTPQAPQVLTPDEQAEQDSDMFMEP